MDALVEARPVDRFLPGNYRCERLTLIDILAVHTLVFGALWVGDEVRALRIFLEPELLSVHVLAITGGKLRLFLTAKDLGVFLFVKDAPTTSMSITVVSLTDITALAHHNFTLLVHRVLFTLRRLTTHLISLTRHSF